MKEFEKISEEFGEELYHENLRHRFVKAKIDTQFHKLWNQRQKEIEDKCLHSWELINYTSLGYPRFTYWECSGECRGKRVLREY